MNDQKLSTVIAAGALVINIVVLAFLIVQIKLLRQQILDAKDAFVSEQHRARAQSTLEYFASTIDRRHSLRSNVPAESDSVEVRRFLERVAKDSAARSDLLEYLNYYEVIAAGANHGIYDTEVINRTSGNRFVQIDDRYRAFIENERTIHRSSTLYEELQKLAATIRRMRAERENRGSIAD